eukprot:scaffold1443_cov113-Cylindrotheca_fusiformis.AAC.3
MFFIPTSALSLLQPEDEDLSQVVDGSESHQSFEDILECLKNSEYSCFCKLKKDWEDTFPNRPLKDEMILRFARCSPGPPFDSQSAWKVMKKYDWRYTTLTAKGLKSQLETKIPPLQTLFPVPGLRTIKDQPVFYMKPARYFPKETSTETITDNLAYVLQTMSEDDLACTDGIGFVANMDDWHMKNFNKDYCFEFMKMLQGSVPSRVDMFLIVNPPTWFNTIWKVMKPMLSDEFQRKVRIISEKKLGKYLQKGFEAYLPDELAIGKVSTDSIVQEFVDSRIRIEEALP